MLLPNVRTAYYVGRMHAYVYGHGHPTHYAHVLLQKNAPRNTGHRPGVVAVWPRVGCLPLRECRVECLSSASVVTSERVRVDGRGDGGAGVPQARADGGEY